jgi:hypothetical protein
MADLEFHLWRMLGWHTNSFYAETQALTSRISRRRRNFVPGHLLSRDLVNVAPLELGEERRFTAHGFVAAAVGTGNFNFWQKAAKRGSFL